jgi:hypothetical protein
MSVTLLKPDGLSMRQKLIKQVAETWIREAPAQAREIAKGLAELKRNQYNKNGKWKDEGNGYFQIGFPAPLFHVMRRVFPVLLPNEQNFATEDDDIVFCMKCFPDLFQGNRDAKVADKKDHRPRKVLYTDNRSGK